MRDVHSSRRATWNVFWTFMPLFAVGWAVSKIGNRIWLGGIDAIELADATLLILCAALIATRSDIFGILRMFLRDPIQLLAGGAGRRATLHLWGLIIFPILGLVMGLFAPPIDMPELENRLGAYVSSEAVGIALNLLPATVAGSIAFLWARQIVDAE